MQTVVNQYRGDTLFGSSNCGCCLTKVKQDESDNRINLRAIAEKQIQVGIMVERVLSLSHERFVYIEVNTQKGYELYIKHQVKSKFHFIQVRALRAGDPF